ncbi:probable helicase L207/L206 at N-terminal half [Coccomyxa sp. Obi]|nr:probable helicase L207/L206 at N-terminal half [Coccomyxa sp. Obi]
MASYVTCCVAKGHERVAKMRFVTGLTVPRTKAEDKRKNIKEWSLADVEVERTRTRTLCEYLSGDRPWTKPYFDTESYHDARPSEEAIEAMRERSLESVDRVMEDQEGYARSAVRVGERHGVDPKHGRYKVSFRMWVMGFKVEYPQLGRLIEIKEVGGDGEGQLDLSVYKGPEQLMNCMGCCKGSLRVKGAKVVDERVLTAEAPQEPWSTYLVQHLRGDERAMRIPASPSVQVGGRASGTRSESLEGFLKAHKVSHERPHRFTAASRPFGSYWVSEAELGRFYDLYVAGLEGGRSMGLTERQGGDGPIVVDIDLRYPLEVEERRYTSETVRSVATAYQESLRAHLDATEEQQRCYVLERRSGPYQTEKVTKDGFHLVFPNARASIGVKRRVREEAMGRCGEALKATGSQTSVKEMVDEGVVKGREAGVNWYVYGSGKPGVAPYTMTRVLGADGREVAVRHTLRELVELLRVSDNCDDLVRSLGALRVSDEAQEAAEQSRDVASEATVNAAAEEVSFELLERVVMGLSVTRALAAEPEWVEVVWAVMNVSKDNDYVRKGRDLVHRFSVQGGERYSEQGVEDKLNALKPREAGALRKQFGSLRQMLKADNSELYGELFELSEIREYKEVKEEFERRHFKLMTPAAYGRVDEEGVFQLRSHSDLVHHMRDVFCVVKKTGRDGVTRPTKTAFFDVWLKDATKRTYERVDMLPPPLECPSDVYNTYRGLRAEKLPALREARSVQIVLDHILMLAGDTGEAGREYLLNYMAHMVQKPGELPKVGILMQSKQGVGKNLLFEELLGKKILGAGLMHCSAQSEDYFGRFDNAAVNKLLCIHDEVVGRDMGRTAGLIKESITAELQGLEEKGLKKVQLRSFVRWIYLTQAIQALLLDSPERRWMVCKCDNSMAPGVGSTEEVHAYFTRLWAWIGDDVNVRAFYEYLLGRDISTWRAVADRPNSTYYRALQRMSMNVVEEWLVSMVENDGLPQGEIRASKARLEALEYIKTDARKSSFTMTYNKFSEFMRPFIEHGVTKRKSSNSIYEFDRDMLHDTLVARNLMDPMASVGRSTLMDV